MIHGYHVILGMYGFRLPNDPRGSWSEVIRKWELIRFGNAQRNLADRSLAELTDEELDRRNAAREQLKYPPVSLTGLQAESIGNGFAKHSRRNNYTIWACAILPEHVHLVIARHTFNVEQMVNLLKGTATRRILEDERHPLIKHIRDDGKIPQMWSRNQWCVYLDSEIAIEEASCYVNGNPEKECKPRQRWKFVTPFGGLPPGGWVTYH